jgi:LuxR family quorum sensing-dependent transcriptional regulator
MPTQVKIQDRNLTAREREVITWAAQGKSSLEIGKILGITKSTVDHHTQSAAQKLGAINKTHTVALAIRRGVIG